MANWNFVRSVSPAWNAITHGLSGQGVASGLMMGAGMGGPLSAPNQQGNNPGGPGIGGSQENNATNWIAFSEPERRQQGNMEWTGDNRNVGYGVGQADPGLAQAVQQQGQEQSGGGK